MEAAREAVPRSDSQIYSGLEFNFVNGCDTAENRCIISVIEALEDWGAQMGIYWQIVDNSLSSVTTWSAYGL